MQKVTGGDRDALAELPPPGCVWVQIRQNWATSVSSVLWQLIVPSVGFLRALTCEQQIFPHLSSIKPGLYHSGGRGGTHDPPPHSSSLMATQPLSPQDWALPPCLTWSWQTPRSRSIPVFDTKTDAPTANPLATPIAF